MSYENINKQINDEIQDLANSIISSLKDNDWDMEKVNRRDLDHLFKLLSPKLKYQIWKYVKNEDELDDLLNNCLIRIFTRLNMYDNTYRFTTWVYTITYNEVVSFIKHKSNKKEIPLNFSSMSNNSMYVDMDDIYYLPELIEFDLDNVVYDEINLLPDGINKDIIIDTQYNKLKIREMATKYDVCENTIKTKQRITRDKIKNGIFEKFPILQENVNSLI